MKLRCTKCGTVREYCFMYCPNCDGMVSEGVEEAKVKCPKCSEELENSSGGWICQFCGYDDKQSRIEELEGNCDDRNHVGLEKVINKMGLGQEIFPDSELGQNVAFLAMVIQDMMNKNKELEARLSTALTALREIDEYLLDVEIQIDDHRNLLPHVHELIKAALDKVEGK